MLMIYKNIKIIMDNEKKIVHLKVKNLEQEFSLKEEINKIKKEFPDYNFYVIKETLDISEDKITINKVSDYVKKKIKTDLKLIDLDIRKMKTGSFQHLMLFQIPNKEKTLKGIYYNDSPEKFKLEKIYEVEGEIYDAGNKYIKKSEKLIGKKNDYQIKIKEITEIVNTIEEIKTYEKSRAELHCHTMFSKNDGMCSSKDYLNAFNSNKCHALAITDHNAVFAFIPFVNELKGKTDKKLILGTEIYGVDLTEHKAETNKRIKELEDKIYHSNSIELLQEEIQTIELEIETTRKERDSYKKIMTRKTVSEEEKEEAKNSYEESVQLLNDKKNELKEIKLSIKTEEALIESNKKELEKLKGDLENTNNIDRDHLIVLLKTPDEEIDYRGEKLKINLGLVELYKMITKSYTNWFSSPTDQEKKMYGKRPVVPYEYLFKPEIRKHFILSSACVFGKHMKLLVDNKIDELREWIKNLDAVELHPSWNNSFMINHSDFISKGITKIEDVYELNHKLYQICKEENVKVIIVSDAHVMNKEQRILRSNFKGGYINLILSSFAKGDETRKSTDEDFNIETQPYVMSYEDMKEDFLKQGFTEEQIEEMHNNTNELAEKAVNAFEVTLLPKKLFLPDFPNMNAKEELPKIVWENAIKKFSKDGTIETIDKKIIDRIEHELELTAESGFEVLYMIARQTCIESNNLGFTVGSRGSVGSMLISYLAGISDVLPLEPHYLCPNCKHIEWVKTDLTGLDLPDKKCPHCNTEMEGNGVDIESHNFVGWIERGENGKIQKTKIPDIDLNFSEEVQSIIHEKIKDLFGHENAIKSGTQQEYQENALKNDIFRNINNISEKVKSEEFDIDYMARNMTVMRTTGSHPGGILLKPNDIPFEYVTPLVYVSDDPKKKELSSFVDYHAIEDNLIKIDALGHSDPTMLKELHDFTGYDFRKIKFNNPEMFKAIIDKKYLNFVNKEAEEMHIFPANTLAISEMNTDFTLNFLSELKPKSMYDMFCFSALTHGTAVLECQKQYILQGKPLKDLVTYRDVIFQQLTRKYGFEPKQAFLVSENVRKGKGIEKFRKELEEKCPKWYVEILDTIIYLFPKASRRI